MKLRLAALALVLFLFSPPAVRAGPPDVSPVPDTGLSAAIGPAELTDHVKTLASDAYMGRRAGTKGAEMAAAYIEERFREIGLAPVGDGGGYLQWFDLPGRRHAAKDASISVTSPATASGSGAGDETSSFAPGEDFTVFGNAADGDLEDLPVVFAGYGIRAPALGWDEYANVDARGKVVLVLRHGPREGSPGYRYRGRNMKYVTFEQKARNAAAAGAAAVVLVNDVVHHPGAEDRLVPVGLAHPLPIPFLFAKAKVARAVFRAAGRDFDQAQTAIDRNAAPDSGALPGVRVSLHVRTVAVRSANVAGLLPGSDEKLRDEVVIIGAHYDHLGTDGLGALDPQAAGEIHNGADDNASGTAGVIELAEHFALTRPRPKRSLLFLCFTGEELGLLGSEHYVEHPLVPLGRTAAMLNLDMVGRSRNGYLFIGGTGTSPVFSGILSGLVPGCGLSPQLGEGGLAPSDNTSFFRKGIPSLFFFTGMHPDYHRATDDWDKLNYDAEAQILRLVAGVASRIADLPERPAYVADKKGGFPGGPSGPYLGVRLGDAAGEGVEIAGVMPGTPAEAAGLLARDRIVAVNGTPVSDARVLVALLSKQKAGDKIVLRVLRGEAHLELSATLAGR